jgi:hypothetical protein
LAKRENLASSKNLYIPEEKKVVRKPEIKFIPLRSAVSSDQETYLDLLIKIVPPALENRLNRPALNIGLVIDRYQYYEKRHSRPEE